MHKLLQRQHQILHTGTEQTFYPYKQQGRHNSYVCISTQSILNLCKLSLLWERFIHSKFVKTEVDALNTMMVFSKIKPGSNSKFVIFLTHFSEKLVKKTLYFIS